MKSSRALSIIAGALLLSSSARATDLTHSITGQVTDGAASIPYRLFTPEPTSAKTPLVVFLHGMGERGTDNKLQTTHINGLVNATHSGAYSSYVLAPQINPEMWYAGSKTSETQAMKLTIQSVKNVIQSNPNIDTSRVYITGLSMGGMGVWDALYRETRLFAAAVPMSGGGDVQTASAIKDTPIWAFHGGDDQVVPVSATQNMIAALKDAGGSPKYTELPGQGHEIWDNLYNDPDGSLYSWLFAQHRNDVLPTTLTESTTSPLTAVPEPGSATLIVGALVTAALRRRR